jgi:hypothetical protein
VKYLPEVGDLCEREVMGLGWDKCIVNYIGKKFCVYSNSGSVEVSHPIKDVTFRPIKTDREKFTDAAMDVTTDSNCYYSRSGIAGLIYDSGLFQLKDNQDD